MKEIKMTAAPDLARISRLADERLAKLDTPSADRPIARRTLIAQIEREEADAILAETAKSEAAAERARINAIVSRGRDLGKARKALRLALSGPVTRDQATTILPTMAKDAEVGPLILPTMPAYGTAAEQAERKRIASIFTSPAAVERFNAACSFALLGDAPVAAVTAMLAQLEVEAAPPRLLTIAERAAEMTEAGPDPFGDQLHGMSKDEKIRAMWSKAVKAANESIGVKSAPEQPAPLMTAPPVVEQDMPEWAKGSRR